MIVIGIDNGLDGAIVAIKTPEMSLCKHVAPTIGKKNKGKRSLDLSAMVRIIGELVGNQPAHAFLEHAQSMPKQGVSSMFKIGVGYGMWQGALVGMQIPFEIIHPRTWQKEMFFGMTKGDSKASSIITAQRLRPDVDWRDNSHCRKAHDGLTDAFCIAEYGVRQLAKRSHKAVG